MIIRKKAKKRCSDFRRSGTILLSLAAWMAFVLLRPSGVPPSQELQRSIHVQTPAVQNSESRTTIQASPMDEIEEAVSNNGVEIRKGALNSSHTTPRDADGKKDARVKVFIGIKTADPNSERFSQIQRTWLEDALDLGVHIKFFTGKGATAPDERNIVGSMNAATIQSLMVPVEGCKYSYDLNCKTSAMFRYFLDADTESHFICNFDDDNYILVSNLLNVLTDYYYEKGRRDVYVGRISMQNGVTFHNVTVQFLTGGAGYCLSRELVEQARDDFTSLRKGAGDDIAVGYVVQETLGVKFTENDLFHSHYEGRIQKQMVKPEDIARQVCYGYSDKQKRAVARKSLPPFPTLFSQEKDPFYFRSLRCFLQRLVSPRAADSEGCPTSEYIEPK